MLPTARAEMLFMAQSSGERDSRLRSYEELAKQAHESALAELRQQWQQQPMNGPAYALRYTPFVEAYFRVRNYQAVSPA
jgi:hypothetical protein